MLTIYRWLGNVRKMDRNNWNSYTLTNNHTINMNEKKHIWHAFFILGSKKKIPYSNHPKSAAITYSKSTSKSLRTSCRVGSWPFSIKYLENAYVFVDIAKSWEGGGGGRTGACAERKGVLRKDAFGSYAAGTTAAISMIAFHEDTFMYKEMRFLSSSWEYGVSASKTRLWNHRLELIRGSQKGLG